MFDKLKNKLSLKHYIFSVIAIMLIIGLTVIIWQSFLNPAKPDDGKNVTEVSIKTNSPEQKIPEAVKIKNVPTKIELVASNLFVPWSISFTSKDRILLTERNGKIREIKNGVLNPTALKTFNNVSATGEEGLMGMALDPDYNSNKHIFIVYAYPKDDAYKVRLVRLTDKGDTLGDDKIIIDNIPGSRFHIGGRLKFGPDQKLYLTTGENTRPNLSQDLTSIAGKILRYNKDGSIPSDNPFPNSPIYSYGHRNPQGIDWHPISKILVETEHGPSGYDGRRGGDEVNIIEKGANYGWPVISYDEKKDGMRSPDIMYFDSVAPGSGSFYPYNNIPQFENSYFFGALKDEGIYQVFFDESNTKIIKNEKLAGVDFGRIREVVPGLDGNLYFSTSNKDGSGKPKAEDDKIYRIVRAN